LQALSGRWFPVELYNLNTDAAETRNPAAAHPDVVERID